MIYGDICRGYREREAPLSKGNNLINTAR